MAIETLVAHRRIVRLPSHPFTARHQDRATLSGRRLVRMSVGPIIEARRAASARSQQPVTRPVMQAPVCEMETAPRQWPWTLASLAMIVLIVAACVRVVAM